MTIAARMRSFGWFLIALLYAFLAREFSTRAAHGLASGDWFELAYCGIVLFLLLLGFAVMGMVGQGQQHPLAAMGLARRRGWSNEFALGSALGWGALIACVLPLALFGGMSVTYRLGSRHLVFLVVDLVVLALASLAEEVVFRGYPFQRLMDATGPLTATVLMSLVFAAVHGNNPDFSWAALFTTMLAGLLMALAYLRTRALWVAWGFHFAWNASMAVLFGLPVSGMTTFSPVVSTYTHGPLWLTGGGYGPEGSAVAIVVLLIMMYVLAGATEELKHEHAGPVIVPGGIPVDIDAISRRQHEAAMGPSAPPPLVQIAPPGAPAPLPGRPPED